ncbi:MAG: metallophosphoesterase [Clostridiales bacterium]|nr:metallophosphoesterase [Clostridiales bacterium]
MRIGVFSDTHGDTYALKKAIEKTGEADLLIHLGDYCRDAESVSKELKREIICVKGNCDFNPYVKTDKIITVEGKRILLTHGHKYSVKYDYTDICFKAIEEKVDAVFFGHTHFAEAFEKDNILFLNPGSLSLPKGDAETYAVVTIDSGLIVPSIQEL